MSEAVFADTLKQVGSGRTLSAEESAAAFASIMRGEVSQPRIAAFLTALAVRRPQVPEIVGAVRAMRASMRKVRSLRSQREVS